MNKSEIISASRDSFKEFSAYCMNVSDEKFFEQPGEKWSIAQNVDHLIRSMKQTRLAYLLPKFILRLYVGKPNRASRSYDELVANYDFKLAQGGKASGVFIPPPVNNVTKEKLIDKWDKKTVDYLTILNKRWSDETLDNYIAPHPLLGKITLRELCYFTIYHTRHHLHIIKQRNQ